MTKKNQGPSEEKNTIKKNIKKVEAILGKREDLIDQETQDVRNQKGETNLNKGKKRNQTQHTFLGERNGRNKKPTTYSYTPTRRTL